MLPRKCQEFLPSHHRQRTGRAKVIRSFLTAMASAVALCGCAAQPVHWAKPDTPQYTFKQRWAQDTFKQDTFKQRLGEASHPRQDKKDRRAARLAQGLNGLDWH
jgi:cation transport regulator ChaB